jgi:hypothetical protein
VDAILAKLSNILDPEKQSKFVSFSKAVGRAFVIFKRKKTEQSCFIFVLRFSDIIYKE